MVQTIYKYSLYGHLLPFKEKHWMESLSSDWYIIAYPVVYQVVSVHFSDHMIISE